jgi:hypothetical protein
LLTINSILSDGEEQYYVLTNADGKAWYLPLRNLQTALNLYQPSGRKGILLKSLFPYLHRYAAIKKVVGAKLVACSLDREILSVAENAFDVNDIEYSVFGGTPSVHQKITIQFFQRNKILGYGKVTDSASIAKLFVHEQRLLSYLCAKGLRNIPECLLCRKLLSKRYIFLQSTTKTNKSFSPNKWTKLHEKFLDDLAQKTREIISFRETDYYKALIRLIELLPVIPVEQRNIIATAIDVTLEEYKNEPCAFSAYHADFTPWNMFITGRNLFVFDWEYGCSTYPSKLDKYHFHVQQYIHVNHLSAEAIHAKLSKCRWYEPRMMRLYLLDIISRFVSRENGKISDDLMEILQIWTKLLSLI